MRELGQLQPVVVLPDLRLVAGGRRLALPVISEGDTIDEVMDALREAVRAA